MNDAKVNSMVENVQDNGQDNIDPERLHMGYIISVVSGVLIVLQGVVRVVLGRWPALFGRWVRWVLFLGIGEFRRYSLSFASLTLLGVITIVLGIVILIGALLIRKGRAKEGAVTVLAFSVLSVFTGGGYIAGLILGVIGSAIVLSKRKLSYSKKT
jgi:hypothetical protein